MITTIEGVRPAGRTWTEIPEPIRKALAEAHNPWFHDAPPDRVTVEFDAHNEMDLREHLARWMPYFRVPSPDRYREYVARVAGECAGKNRLDRLNL